MDNLNDGFSPLQFETSAESNNAFSETSLIFKQFLVQYQQLATQIYVMHSTVQVRNEGRPGAGGSNTTFEMSITFVRISAVTCVLQMKCMQFGPTTNLVNTTAQWYSWRVPTTTRFYEIKKKAGLLNWLNCNNVRRIPCNDTRLWDENNPSFPIHIWHAIWETTLPTLTPVTQLLQSHHANVL